MIRSTGLHRGLGVAVGVAIAAGSASPPPAVAAEAPSVRLLGTERKVVIRPHGARRVPLGSLGTFVAADGGELRIDVSRPSYSGWRAAQVDGDSGAELRELPASTLDGLRGLDRFLRVEVRRLGKPNGKPLAVVARPFCPNSGGRERVDDSGPAIPRYAYGCGDAFPFVRGMAWGLDAGWATKPRLGSVRVAPGRYRATIRITDPYRTLFEIAGTDAETAVKLRVKRPRRHPGPNPVPIPLPELPGSAADAAAAPLAAPVVADPDPATLPDLAALPLWNVRAQRRGKRDLIGFASSPWNAGPAPLTIEGFRQPGAEVMDAYQYFFDSSGEVVGKAPAGSMHFHRARGHHHWHFEQFARFSLVKPGGGETVRSRKQSFCIVPTDPVDMTVLGAEWLPDLNAGSSCGGPGSIWIRENLPAGWADTYYQSVAGQAFDVTSLPNGKYRVFTEVNPLGLLKEKSFVNNVAVREIVLRGRPGARYVVQRDWLGVVD